ncbi:MAG TPA: OmpA family protein [Caulobacterales bacterium]|nr:OmpA family protein [Caulobacterales bacterium]
MRKLLKTVALAALLAASAGAAHATEGWYARGDVGYTVDGELDFNPPSADLKKDWMESLGLGYAFNNGFRVEGELSHRYNGLDEDANIADGGVHAWAAMANVYYDFNRGGSIQPYVGLGAGAAKLVSNTTFTGGQFYDDSDTVAAYQAMIGVAFPVTEQLDVDIGYRYFHAPNANFDGYIDFPATGTFDGDYTNQAVTVGLRWQFAAPPPPPPPPAPPTPPPAPPPPPPPPVCPTSDFVVYFEWDRSNLNQAALEVIDQAVARAQACNVSGVVVIGHTDTSGSAQYNVGLSNRRASVVRDALVARGLPAGAITTEGRGETDLAKPTRNGVREPLNRRTAVTISFR